MQSVSVLDKLIRYFFSIQQQVLNSVWLAFDSRYVQKHETFDNKAKQKLLT